jgi:hypothetical protein
MNFDGLNLFRDVTRDAQELRRKALSDWLGRLVTLSSGALTLLVSLQNTYVPKNPQEIWLLAGCWIGLGISVLAGILALFGAVRVHEEFHIALWKKIEDDGRSPSEIPRFEAQAMIASIPYKYRSIFHGAIFLCSSSFAVAVLMLGWFAVLNLLK